MKIFKLPDLGEGLPEAEIREWYIQPGDKVTTDQPLVAVETAKALVDVPAPFDGEIEKLFGEPGNTIETGKPLIGFVGEHQEDIDEGTVVGSIATSDEAAPSAVATATPQAQTHQPKIKATPRVRALAKRMGIDLNTVEYQGERITQQDLERAAQSSSSSTAPQGYQALTAVRRAMVLSMRRSHAEVVPITVTEEVDISTWFKQQDLTLRVIRAMIQAIAAEPILNSHLDAKSLSYQTFSDTHLGLAVDTEHGLYVPVIRETNRLNDEQLREQIETYKQQALSKSINQKNLQDASIVLSNFGTFAGRLGTPIITPPMVAILGTGRVYAGAVVKNNQLEPGYLLPLSLSVDHRLITGGEATRFLKVLKDNLQAKS